MLSIPNLPTDNLYKLKAMGFMAIAGLLIVLLGDQFYKSVKMSIDLSYEEHLLNRRKDLFIDKIKKSEAQGKLFEKEIKSMKLRDLEMESKYDFLKKNNKRLVDDKNFREYWEFFYKYRSELVPYYELLEKSDKLNSEINQDFHEIQLLDIDLEEKKNKSTSWISNIIIVFCGFLFVIGFCIYESRKAFNQWQIRVQDLQDEKLKLELEILRRQVKNEEALKRT